MIRNPILAGSHPDPSVLRVGSDFYIATSTFEWFPGVRLHHSRDLVSWRSLGGALDRVGLLDLTGCPDSGGVWAPNLSYADGLFHLVYSNVSTYEGGFTDSPNFVVTAASVEGPWSDPVLLHSRGFDASLFHDDGESWLVNMVHDWRPGHGGSAGLEVTRYDRAARRLIGDPVAIVLPADGGWVEGPNLYRRGPWYYLITADGGTGYDHQVSVARSRSVAGPYVRDPHGPLLTARDHPDLPLQKAGHGSLVETEDGRSYLAYLVARPSGRHGPCVMGRETALAPVRWTEEGWPRVPTGLPQVEILHEGDERRAVPDAIAEPSVTEERTVWDGTDGVSLGPEWSTLRRPAGQDWVGVIKNPSRLRVRGGRSPQSLVGPSLVARRVTAARCGFETVMDYAPRGIQHLAGVVAYYNSRNWHYLYVTADDDGRTVLRVASSDRGVVTVDEPGQALVEGLSLRLGLDTDGPDLRFRWSDGAAWHPIGPLLDATILSDEHAVEYQDGQIRAMGFTGAFVGLWVWDLAGGGHTADFGETVYTTRA